MRVFELSLIGHYHIRNILIYNFWKRVLSYNLREGVSESYNRWICVLGSYNFENVFLSVVASGKVS